MTYIETSVGFNVQWNHRRHKLCNLATRSDSEIMLFSVSKLRLFMAVGCIQVYDVSEGLSPVLFSSYNKLTKSEKVEWNNRCSFCLGLYKLKLCLQSQIETTHYKSVLSLASVLTSFNCRHSILLPRMWIICLKFNLLKYSLILFFKNRNSHKS